MELNRKLRTYNEQAKVIFQLYAVKKEFTNMMNDVLQYVPYALFFGAIF